MNQKHLTAPPVTAQERERIKAVREKFQAWKPTEQELLATGDYDGPYEGLAFWAVRSAVSSLQHLREQQGRSQQDLARCLDMDVAELQRIEAGHQIKVSLYTLARIARALGCTLAIRPEPIKQQAPAQPGDAAAQRG